MLLQIVTPLYKAMKRQGKSKSPQKNKNKDNNTSHVGKRLLLEVQVCCQSGEHPTKSNQWIYAQQYSVLKHRMESEGIEVRRKGIPDDLYRRSPYCPPNLFHKKGTKESVYFPRIGAFQIYFQDTVLFSRLQSHKWPDLNKLLVDIYRKALQNSSQQDKAEKRKVKSRATNQGVLSGIKSFTKSIESQSHNKTVKQYFRVRSTLHGSSSHNTTLNQSLSREASSKLSRNISRKRNRYLEGNDNDKSERSSAQKSLDLVNKSLEKGWQSVAGPTQNRLKEVLKNSIEAAPTRATLEAYMQPLFPRHTLRQTKKLIQRTIEARRQIVHSRQGQRQEERAGGVKGAVD